MANDPNRANLFGHSNPEEENIENNCLSHLDGDYDDEVGEPGPTQMRSDSAYQADVSSNAVASSGGFPEEIFSNDHEDEGLEE